MKEEIHSYNEEEQLKSLVNNRDLKSTKRMQCLSRNNIVALKEKDGGLIEDRDRMIKRCEAIYTELYSTRRPQHQPFSSENSIKVTVKLLNEIDSSREYTLVRALFYTNIYQLQDHVSHNQTIRTIATSFLF